MFATKHNYQVNSFLISCLVILLVAYAETLTSTNVGKKCASWKQARRHDLAAEGAKKQKRGHILKILYWMYAAIRGPNVKWGAHISNRRTGHHWSAAGDGPAWKPHFWDWI